MKITNESPLGTNNRNAVIAGALFIIGTVSGMISAMISSPIWNAPDYLLRLPANESIVYLATILQFIMGISCAGISMALYPILRNYSPGLAVGSVGFRLIENVLQILKAISMIALLAIGQLIIQTGIPEVNDLQNMAQIITAASDWMTHGAALISFSIGAAMYYIVFYQYRLVPRWLSVWGLVGVSLVTIASGLVMLGVIPGFGTVQMIANLPILPQEMVLAVWLIVKGVQHQTTTTSVSVQPALI